MSEIDDQRDYAEEAFNAELLANPDQEPRPVTEPRHGFDVDDDTPGLEGDDVLDDPVTVPAIERAAESDEEPRHGAHIMVTNEMAQVVALIAKKHPEAAIAIDWNEGEPEMFWFVTADDGASHKSYVVDDESGTWAPLSADEQAAFDADQLVFGERGD